MKKGGLFVNKLVKIFKRNFFYMLIGIFFLLFDLKPYLTIKF